MSRTIAAERIEKIGVGLFRAAGVPKIDAGIAVEALVQSSLMGHDSHGIMRIPEYLGFVEDGTLQAGAEIKVEYRGPSTAMVDCGYNFGAIGGLSAINVACKLAERQQTATVITHRCHHVGRLGAYVERAARQGLLAIATCNSPIYGHFVLPWGGRQGRLATNPIAYGIPTESDPLVADFSTSVSPEGKIRWYRNRGEAVPEGWILDAEGKPTCDPNDFYGPPRGGILPLGGSAGHKGYALGLLVEILGTALSGVSSLDADVRGNGVCFLVVNPAAFVGLERFKALATETSAYLKSAETVPGVDEVLVPGELEFRTRRQRLEEGIPVDQMTWDALQEWAQKLKVAPEIFAA